ncbi:hypothetical protein C8Q77DRAFT_12608 [Trametes polyzona]|nr:hypothetical protein C8Q77DRAFT_12608 [Trametes polyzona]
MANSIRYSGASSRGKAAAHGGLKALQTRPRRATKTARRPRRSRRLKASRARTHTLRMPPHSAMKQTHKMPRNAPALTSTRRVTRSMTKIQPLEDITNTAPPVGNGPKQSTPWLEALRLENAPPNDTDPNILHKEHPSGLAIARANESPRDARSTTSHIFTLFETGDRVEVYMRHGGEYTWRPGRVANLRFFHIRNTVSLLLLYMGLFVERRPA